MNIKIFKNEIVVALLIVVLLTSNLISCSPKKVILEKPSSISSDTVYSEDTTVYAETTNIYSEDMQTYAEDLITYSEDMTTYIEELTYYIEDMVFYEFGEYVDDMYVVFLHTQDYIDEHTVIYDPETGRQLNIGSMLAKIAVGTAVIIACITVTVATGGVGVSTVPQILAIAMPYVQVASAGAATGAAISGSINYIASGGNKEEFLYGAIEGAADGFMWGAVLSPGAVKLAKLQIGKVADASKNVSQITNFSAMAQRTVTTISNSVDDIIRAVTQNELIAKYGNYGLQIADDIKYYTGYGFRKIQSTIWNNIDDPVIRGKIARISGFLKDQSLIRDVTLYRGDNLPVDLLAERYGLRNVMGKTPVELAEMINKSTTVYVNAAFTSTSKELGNSIKYIAAHGTGKINPSNIKIIRELRIAGNTKGVFGADVSLLSKYPWQKEVLLDTGLKTKPVSAYLERIRSGQAYHDVIHIIEEVL
jgi:hypothetical protein